MTGTDSILTTNTPEQFGTHDTMPELKTHHPKEDFGFLICCIKNFFIKYEKLTSLHKAADTCHSGTPAPDASNLRTPAVFPEP